MPANITVNNGREWLSRRPAWLTQLACFGLLWVGFIVLDTVLARSTRMRVENFDTEFLLSSWIADPGTGGALLVAAFAAALFLPGMRAGWFDLGAPPPLRLATIAFAATISWPFLTVSHNYFFDQTYFWDRLLLLAAVVLVVWRPAAVFGVTALCYLLMWQYSWPELGGPVFAHKHLGLEILTALTAWLALRGLNVKVRPVDLLMLWGLLIAARYWSAGYAKLALGWWEYTNVHHALVAAYSHGWLGWATEDFVVGLAQLIARTEPWVPYGVMAFELSAIAFFVHRRVAAVILLTAVIFHLAVVLLYGFVFWTWIVVDLIFLALLFRWPVDPFTVFPALPRIAVSSALIAISPLWTDAPMLAWFDSSVSYSNRFTLHDADGGRYSVTPRFFAPYDDALTITTFQYLSKDHALLAGAYGIVRNVELARQLDSFVSPEEVDLLQSRRPSAYSEEASKRLAHFLERVLAVRNARGPRYTWLRWLSPPAQLQSFLREDAEARYDGSEKISRVTLDMVTTWFRDGKIHEVRRATVLDVAVPDEVPPVMWQEETQ